MKLVATSSGKIFEELEIPANGEITIGRHPDNNLAIEEIKASRFHGRLISADGTFSFEDLGSGNGTVIAGDKIAPKTPVTVTPETEIIIGSFSLKIEDAPVTPKSTGSTTVGAAPSGDGTPVAEGRTGMLEGIAGGVEGKKFGLGVGGVVVGRTPECHIQIQDGLSSRRNTEFTLENNIYRVKDLGSTNGTFVNDKKVTEAVKLADGDVVTVGEKKFRFSLTDAASAPAVPTPGVVPSAQPGAAPGAAAGTGGGGMLAAAAVIGIVIIALVAYLILSNRDKPEGPVTPGPSPATPGKTFPVKLGKPVRMDMPVTLEKTGNIEAAVRSEVLLTVGSKVDMTYVSNNQQVKVGDRLIKLETTEAIKASLSKAKAALAVAEDDVGKAERSLKNAKENLKIAESAWQRNKVLYDAGNLIQTSWDKIQRSRNNSMTEVDIKTKEKEQAKQKVKQAAADLKDASAKAGDLLFKAKIDGIVSGFDFKKGYTVTNAKSGFSIIQFEKKVKVKVAIPEDDIASIRTGMTAEVWLSRAPEKKAAGRVTLIPPTATRRSYDVELEVMNSEKHFRPGAQAMVRLSIALHKNALTVPATIVQSGKRGDFFVYLFDSAAGKVKELPIKRGAEKVKGDMKLVELLPLPGSLHKPADTDLYVFEGYRNLQDGAVVEVKNRAEVGLK